MSTHLHLIITDTHGNLPDFLQWFHRMVALATQCHRGWGEEVFNKSQTSVVELPTAEAAIQEMAYTIVNSVAAGAVRYAKDWPGLKVRVQDIGSGSLGADRPNVFFRKDNGWADRAEIPLTWPAVVLEEVGPEEATRRLTEAVAEQERQARAEVKAKGWRFAGAERCMKAPITRRSTAYEVWGGRNPTFATGGDPEVGERMRHDRRDFRARYREALARWRAGDREVRFPLGTWLIRKLHRALLEVPEVVRGGAVAASPAPS